MSLMESMKNLLKGQKKLISAMEEEIETLDSHDLVNENQNLKQELDQTQENLHRETAHHELLANENKALKNALYEQVYNEKMRLLQAANHRSELYFASKTETELNRLKSFEKNAKSRIDKLYAMLQKNRVSKEEEIYSEIGILRNKVDVLTTLAESSYVSEAGAITKQKNDELAALEQEKLSEKEYKEALDKSNIETFIGLNALSKIGILFLLVAVIALSRYGYVLLTPLLKGIVIFGIGGLLLGFGEWLNHKATSIFSIALTSGGIAILYGATALSYLTLDILSIEIALLLCVLNTILAFVLSLRYDAQTIVLFALIGGYLPIVTITDSAMPVGILMVYFIFLNLFLLLISTQKKWTVNILVGFLFNIASSIYIMHMVLSIRRSATPFGIKDVWLLLYILFVFLNYTLIPIVTAYKRKTKFALPDILLIGFNTLVSAVLLNIVFYSVHLQSYMGTLAVLFASVYLMLGWWMEKKMSREKRMISLFYLTGFAFILLFIPLQFNTMWLSLGWLVEGVLLAVYGILKEDKELKWGGIIACLLSLGSFLIGDVLGQIIHPSSLFTYKYLAITIGSIAVLAALTFKKTLQTNLAKAFKYATVINVWFFILYILHTEWYSYMLRIPNGSSFDILYLVKAAAIVLTFLLSFSLKQIKILADEWMKLIQSFFYFVGILWLFSLHMNQSPVPFTGEIVSTGLIVSGTLLLVFVGLLSIVALWELIQAFASEKSVGIGHSYLFISAYAVIIITQYLITQYGFGFQSLVISLVYVLTAFLWILFGFLKRNATIRKFGLGLSILATAKLVFLDLSGLSSFARVISYFAFGIFLLGISLVYQHFHKRLQLQIKDVQNEN